MARIEGISIENYRALRQVTLGQLFGKQIKQSTEARPLPGMVALIGPNGAGKSTVMDAIGFLRDCLAEGVEEACDKPQRGGLARLRTQGSADPIRIRICYREAPSDQPIVYAVSIDSDEQARPAVVEESLTQKRGAGAGRPFEFLKIKGSKATAWAGFTVDSKKKTDQQILTLEDRRKLGIATLGNLGDHPRIVKFREFLEGWYLSYFNPEGARRLPAVGAQRHLNREGDNLANYVQYLESQHGANFKRVLSQVAKRIPGVKKIKHSKSLDGRLLLEFSDRGFSDPFYAGSMSDGTLKFFAYMMLLEDPAPAPLIGIEEPENGLYHRLLAPLAQEMRARTLDLAGSQIFVTTHSSHFVDALAPSEVFILSKAADGSSQIRCVGDLPDVSGMANEGLPLGGLWYSNHFGEYPP